MTVWRALAMPHSPKPLTCSGVLQSWSRGGQAKASNKQIKHKVLSSVCVASHPCGLFDWRRICWRILCRHSCSRCVSDKPAGHLQLHVTSVRHSPTHQPAASTSDDHGDYVHWSYSGAGAAQYWGSINNAEYALCSTGSQQSPINIITADATVISGTTTRTSTNAIVANNPHFCYVANYL